MIEKRSEFGCHSLSSTQIYSACFKQSFARILSLCRQRSQLLRGAVGRKKEDTGK
jgi:hypothetical protein